MNGSPSREQVERLKQQYPEGTKICCDRMNDDPRPIPPGTMGRVLFVDDVGTVHCAFDNGRQLGLVSGVDSFHTVTLIDEMRAMDQDDLCEYGIVKFDSFEELFDYIYDENTGKEDIINDMSDKMKKELINNNYSDRIMSDGKAFYYNSDDFSELQIQRHDEIDSDSESFQTENDKEYVVSGKLVDREKCRYGDVYVFTCYDDSIPRVDDNGNEILCKGYYCQVFSDSEYTNEIDSFCLAEGVEITDMSDEAVTAGIKSYLGLNNEDIVQDENESQGMSIDL